MYSTLHNNLNLCSPSSDSVKGQPFFSTASTRSLLHVDYMCSLTREHGPPTHQYVENIVRTDHRERSYMFLRPRVVRTQKIRSLRSWRMVRMPAYTARRSKVNVSPWEQPSQSFPVLPPLESLPGSYQNGHIQNQPPNPLENAFIKSRTLSADTTIGHFRCVENDDEDSDCRLFSHLAGWRPPKHGLYVACSSRAALASQEKTVPVLCIPILGNISE